MNKEVSRPKRNEPTAETEGSGPGFFSISLSALLFGLLMFLCCLDYPESAPLYTTDW